jgi:hypothetical protein
MRKMVSRGWAYKLPEGGYQLRSYQYVWWTMGTVRTIKERSKKEGYQYTKIWEHKNTPLSTSDYKGLVGQIRLQLANRKIRQIKHRLVRGRGIDLNNKSLVKRTALDVALKEKPMLSCKRVADVFGYKSSASVWKDYGFYFSKVPQKKVIIVGYDDDMKRTFKYPCNRIHLFESNGNV